MGRVAEQLPPAYPVPAKDAFTPWITRFLAFLIDAVPIALVSAIVSVYMASTNACVNYHHAGGIERVCKVSGAGLGVWVLGELVVLIYIIWNYGYRQGTTGSSIGKSVMKFKVISEKTGQPIGFGMSVVRQLAHVVDAIICYIGFLFPLWDAKRQTLADKIMTTVCIPA
ncbi:MAG: RDD family protein [Mycolicibacterium insubricum]